MQYNFKNIKIVNEPIPPLTIKEFIKGKFDGTGSRIFKD